MKQVYDDKGFSASFEIDEFRRRCLLDGLDDIGLTLRHEAQITAYEQRHASIETRVDDVGAGSSERAESGTEKRS